jgi:hypothetical protein
MSIKNLLVVLLTLLNVTIFAQPFTVNSPTFKKGIVSGPWAGNIELRNATIWVEVTPQIKSVAVKYFAEGNKTEIKTQTYKGALGNDFNPVKIALNGLEINKT